MRALGGVLLLIALASCHEPAAQQELRDFLDRPERQLKTYQADLSAPLVDRVRALPEPILHYLNEMDSTDRYQSYLPTAEERRLFAEYYALLPASFQKVMEAQVVGVYFVSNFGGGGMADLVYDPQQRPYMALYFNAEVLTKSLSEWIEFRETSAFEPGNLTIRVEASKAYRALVQTLFHESAHVYDYYSRVTPFLEPPIGAEGDPTPTAFSAGIWTDYRVPAPSADLLRDSHYSGYGLKGTIPIDRAPELYQRLKTSPFASLYGGLSWAEDWAEIFCWGHLSQTLGVTYKVEVWGRDGAVAEYSPADHPLVMTRYKESL